MRFCPSSEQQKTKNNVKESRPCPITAQARRRVFSSSLPPTGWPPFNQITKRGAARERGSGRERLFPFFRRSFFPLFFSFPALRAVCVKREALGVSTRESKDGFENDTRLVFVLQKRARWSAVAVVVEHGDEENGKEKGLSSRKKKKPSSRSSSPLRLCRRSKDGDHDGCAPRWAAQPSEGACRARARSAPGRPRKGGGQRRRLQKLQRPKRRSKEQRRPRRRKKPLRRQRPPRP